MCPLANLALAEPYRHRPPGPPPPPLPAHVCQSTDTDQSQGMFPSTIYDPKTKTFEPLLGDCGIHDCKNAFCSGACRVCAWHRMLALVQVLMLGRRRESAVGRSVRGYRTAACPHLGPAFTVVPPRPLPVTASSRAAVPAANPPASRRPCSTPAGASWRFPPNARITGYCLYC